jgi:hypothetical protein
VPTVDETASLQSLRSTNHTFPPALWEAASSYLSLRVVRKRGWVHDQVATVLTTIATAAAATGVHPAWPRESIAEGFLSIAWEG